MKTKKVLCCKLEFPDNVDFYSFFRNGFFNSQTIVYNEKNIELSHVSIERNLIYGLFVTTQVRNIPPIHQPGNENDYSAIELAEGKGLAYPNIFLIDASKNIILWEVNRFGVNENSMCRYFEETIRRNLGYEMTPTLIHLHPLMALDAYERISNMAKIDCIEFQIVNPLEYIRTQNANSTLSHIAKVARDFSATKSIRLTVKADEIKSINKSSARRIAEFISSIGLNPKGNTKNKLVIKGVKQENDELVEDTINLLLDRMAGNFNIKEPRLASHLQVADRRKGIKSVYDSLYTDITTLLG